MWLRHGLMLFVFSVAAIAAQASPTWDDNLELRRALCEQRVDARFGLPMLGLGFVIQLVSDFAFTGFLDLGSADDIQDADEESGDDGQDSHIN